MRGIESIAGAPQEKAGDRDATARRLLGELKPYKRIYNILDEEPEPPDPADAMGLGGSAGGTTRRRWYKRIRRIRETVLDLGGRL
jgi:hypothetical protein